MTQPAHFITPLRTEALWGEDGLPLYTRDGRRLYKLLSPLVYWSAKYNRLFVVKEGFITDFGSVPRLPVIYTLFGEIAEEPYPLHDMLYSTGELPREDADAVLLEALEAVGISRWKRLPVYSGVRVGGQSRYCEKEPIEAP